MNGVVFDAGGLIALERNDRRVVSVVYTAREESVPILLPATALAQVIRNPAKQAVLWRLIQREETEIIPLDGSYAQSVGVLLAKTGTRDTTDAHVVVCAQQAGYSVITGDPLDLRRLDPNLRVIAV